MNGKKMRSVEAGRAVWETSVKLMSVKLTSGELLVLHAIAAHADENLEGCPGMNRLAQMARRSRRQIVRIVHGLRQKGLLAFEDNLGGLHKTTKFRLLIGPNSDIRAVQNGDIGNSDTLRKGDISNSERVTSCAETVTNSHANSDIAMSPEWVEWLEGVKTEGGQKITAPLLGNDDVTPQDIDENPSDFLETVFAEGTPVTRNQVCTFKDHGPFVRQGWLWRNWLVWNGQNTYSGYTKDAGCLHCEADDLKHEAERAIEYVDTWPVRHFELKGASVCPTHGAVVSTVTITERSPGYMKRLGGERYQAFYEDCPGCEADMVDEMDAMGRLDLTVEEWELGGKAVLAAVHHARGWIDTESFLDVLENRVVPDLKEKLSKANRPTQSDATRGDGILDERLRKANNACPGDSSKRTTPTEFETVEA